ncbi:MAG: molybdenum cofactor biosynthesis protein MoaE [Gammaproteobacteria bacterium]
MFRISSESIDAAALRDELADDSCGGFVAFEGWVRNHHEGRRVTGLEYEAYDALAVSEGKKIIAEARERFGASRVACVHRVGSLGLGEMAVWVGASAPHRDEAFAACRYVIDEVKLRVPVWKKEHYVEGDSDWVNCARCAEAGHRHIAAEADDRPTSPATETAPGGGSAAAQETPVRPGVRHG